MPDVTPERMKELAERGAALLEMIRRGGAPNFAERSLLSEILSALDHAARLLTPQTGKPPEPDTDYLISFNGQYMIGLWNSGQFYMDDGSKCSAEHVRCWWPLPQQEATHGK